MKAADLAMKSRFSVVALVSAFAGCMQTVPREFGPEWTKVTHEDSSVEYRRNVEVPVVHGGCLCSDYTLKLENDELKIRERDGNAGFSLTSEPFGYFDVRKNASGKASEYVVTLGQVTYLDLNGDGIIDAKLEKNQPFINPFL